MPQAARPCGSTAGACGPATLTTPPAGSTGQQYQNGTRVTNTYDANSQRTVLSDWTGSYTSTYDPDGRLSSVVNPAGLAITYGYDAASQRASLNQPTGLFTYIHDPAGRISTLTNPEGQVTSWQYDAASRVTGDADGQRNPDIEYL